MGYSTAEELEKGCMGYSTVEELERRNVRGSRRLKI